MGTTTMRPRLVAWTRNFAPLAASDAIENDVHVVGVSSQAAGHKTLVPQLIESLKTQGASDMVVVVGGVIPADDYDFLRGTGVSAIFGPGTNVCRAASETLTLIRQRRAVQPIANP